MMMLPINGGILVGSALPCAVLAFAFQATAKKAQSPATSTAPSSKSATPKTDIAQQHFDSAQTYQLAGDFERAAREYRQAVATALDHLGNLRSAKHGYEGAKQLFQQALVANPDNPD